MTTHAPPDSRPVPDSELHRFLAAVVDTDRDESPFGWSEPQPARPQDTATKGPQ